MTDDTLNGIHASFLKTMFPKGFVFDAGRYMRQIGEDLNDDPKRVGIFEVLDENGIKIGEGTRLTLYCKQQKIFFS